MIRMLLLAGILAFLPGCASGPTELVRKNYIVPPGSTVLRIEVLDVQFTDFYPGCGESESCLPFYFWWKYRARVKEVLAGTWSQANVEFAHLQHAQYISKVTKDCYVVMQPAAEDIERKVGVPFVAIRLLSRSFSGDKSIIDSFHNGR